CDDKDNDCDGEVDEDIVFITYFTDADGDGYGDADDIGLDYCSDPNDGSVTNNSDCNDNDSTINPDTVWYAGVDGDGDDSFGSTTSETQCASPGDGYSTTQPDTPDCNDADATVYPGAPEVIDGVDNDCDGLIDEGFVNAPLWTGNISTDWTDSGNWQDNNAPGLSPSEDIIIPGGLTNYPDLITGQNLSIGEGISLTIESGASLNISPAVVITNNGTVIIDGSLTFQSDATGSAYIGAGSGIFTGDVTVERYIPARRVYRQLSTPVTTSTFIANNWQQATHITGSTSGANGFDATATGNPSMYTFDNDAYNYFPMGNTDATNLITGQGYHMLVRGDRTTDLTNNNATPSETTLSATGTLVAENDGSSMVTVDVPFQRFIFVGNPFQAPVNMNTVLTTDATNISPMFYWVWDPNLGSRGAYATVVAATGTATAGDANEFLQAGQAGWVYTAALGESSVSFTQASKNTSVSETAVFKTTAKKVSTGQLQLALYESSALAANESEADGLLVLFDDNGNNEVDGSDAPKFTNLDETFATSNNGTLLGIESRATPIETDEIPLVITAYRNINYTIVAEGTEMQGEIPYLYDSYTEEYIEIPQNGSVNYAYSIDANIPESVDADRFTIVFALPQSLTDINLEMENIMLYPNPSNSGKFYLNIPPNMDDLEVTIYDVLGAKLFYKTGFKAGERATIKTNFTRDQGLYFVNLTSKGATTIKKLVVE
ncbi:MAG: T9SS type A sorting domain-containing protein, partial [Flaviramulus sp.]